MQSFVNLDVFRFIDDDGRELKVLETVADTDGRLLVMVTTDLEEPFRLSTPTETRRRRCAT